MNLELRNLIDKLATELALSEENTTKQKGIRITDTDQANLTLIRQTYRVSEPMAFRLSALVLATLIRQSTENA